MDEPEVEWEDADRILFALMRLSERVEEIEAKLRSLYDLLNGDDDGEEEAES